MLTATHVSKTFSRAKEAKRAVDDVTLTVAPGDFTAVVGESGSGKSTMARIMLGLIQPDPDRGTVTFDGAELSHMSRSDLLHFRSRVQCILQDPSGSLNPRKTVGTAIREVIRLHQVASGRKNIEEKMREAFSVVDLDPEHFSDRYPHQLSGGQRQRVLIAKAVVLEPSIIVADEAVSALDVSVKAGILNLMNRLRHDRGIGYLFITHDLPVVRKVADYVYVMRDGQVVEESSKKGLFASPGTDYTRELLEAAPAPNPELAREWLSAAAGVVSRTV